MAREIWRGLLVGTALWLMTGSAFGQAPAAPTEPPPAQSNSPGPAQAAEPSPAPAPSPMAPAPPPAAAPASAAPPAADPRPAEAPVQAAPPQLATVGPTQAPSAVPVAAVAPPSAAASVAAAEQAAAPRPAAPPVDTDPWARPHFVKGELANFVVRPMTRRNFVGVATGISAFNPFDADTWLNQYYLTVEPQIDITNPKYNWKLGLGAPLQFEIIDTRGAFEVCMGEGRAARMSGDDELTVAAKTGLCVDDQRTRGRLTQNFGQLRRADWDEASDFARVLRYAVLGGQEQPFYLNVSRLYDQSFGHGTVVRDYNPNINYNTARLGANFDFNRSAVGLQAMANDLVRPDVLGLMAFVRPFRPYSENVFLRSLSVGASWVHGVNLPLALSYEPGLFAPSFGQPIPRVDATLNPVGGAYRHVHVMGVDVEGKLIRTSNADMKLYVDYQKMRGYGGGTTVGSLWRLSFGEPAWQALRARAEATYFDPDYMPGFFDAYHDIFQYQYLPVAYEGTNGLTYHPTKLGFLEASRGGRKRVGGYLELAHAFLNYMTLGVTARGWTPIGATKDAAFTAPSFSDYGPNCTDPKGNGQLSCPDKVTLEREQRFASMRFFAELPFRRYLQAFASYEMFSTTAEKGSGLFKFDGDNEVFFSGARLMLLPILFVQAEARRYFFLQRLTNISFSPFNVEQDQRYHSNWTFALNVALGYEF